MIAPLSNPFKGAEAFLEKEHKSSAKRKHDEDTEDKSL